MNFEATGPAAHTHIPGDDGNHRSAACPSRVDVPDWLPPASSSRDRARPEHGNPRTAFASERAHHAGIASQDRDGRRSTRFPWVTNRPHPSCGKNARCAWRAEVAHPASPGRPSSELRVAATAQHRLLVAGTIQRGSMQLIMGVEYAQRRIHPRMAEITTQFPQETGTVAWVSASHSPFASRTVMRAN